ncbi:MAG: sigma-70 family RNA polymerase sigma factor [bacterium]
MTQRDRQLARRLADAVQRMGRASADEGIVHALTAGTAVELFAQFQSDSQAIVTAAHECAMLRYAYIVAIVAQSFRFDGYERDDLVQRVFLELPAVVQRAREDGRDIPNPEGWLHRRAHLMARQLLREEFGAPVHDIETGTTRRDADGRVIRTRGQRVGVEELERAPDLEAADDDLFRALESRAHREQLHLAIADLEREQPLGAKILRLQLDDGCRLDEIASRLGRAHGTVRNDALKARRRLGDIIRERYPQLASSVTDSRGGQDAIA